MITAKLVWVEIAAQLDGRYAIMSTISSKLLAVGTHLKHTDFGLSGYLPGALGVLKVLVSRTDNGKFSFSEPYINHRRIFILAFQTAVQMTGACIYTRSNRCLPASLRS